MRITVEVSLYPLSETFISPIRRFILQLRRQAGIEVVTNQLSTQLRGDYDDVMAALARCMKEAMSDDGTVVFVTKFVNADLAITAAPRIEPQS